MKYNGPLSSLELNDFILSSYEQLISLIGYDEIGYTHYSGLYEYINSSGVAHLESISGVPQINVDETFGGLTTSGSYIALKDILKYDYLNRKIFGLINRSVFDE